MRLHGSCHCGKVAFDVEGEVDGAISCNCSICSRKGSLLWFVPRTALTLTTPEENFATYTFNTGRIKHHFCTTCGIHPFGEGVGRDGTPMAAVNIRCLGEFELASVPVREFDGRSL